MHLQPNRDYVSDDVVQTPPALARRLVAHFDPRGRILEPCAGAGNFLRALSAHCRGQTLEADGHPPEANGRNADAPAVNGDSLPRPLGISHAHGRPDTHANGSAARHSRSVVHWCEVQRGRDFFAWTDRVDWIVTNPPWSDIRRFLQHGMNLADHIVFLLTINHVWTRARVRDVRAAGFGVREMVLLDMPPTFPQSGFQLGAVHFARGWNGPIALTNWTDPHKEGRKASGRRPKAKAAG